MGKERRSGLTSDRPSFRICRWRLTDLESQPSAGGIRADRLGDSRQVSIPEWGSGYETRLHSSRLGEAGKADASTGANGLGCP